MRLWAKHHPFINHSRGLIHLLFLLIALAGLFDPSDAWAGGGGGGGALGGVQQRCEQIKQEVSSSDQDGIWLVEYIVTCVDTVIREAFTEFLEGFYPHVARSITALLTLAVTIFGVMLLAGMVDQPARDGFVVLLKLACVLYFVQTSVVQEVYDMSLAALDGATQLVFQYGSSTNTSPRCPDNETLWDKVDCTIDVLIGIYKPDTGAGAGSPGGGTSHTGVSRGLLHFAAAMAATASVGAMVGMLVLYIIYTTLTTIMKAIQTYISAMIGISFMLMLAPLFVPMLMFRITREFFDKWARIAIGFVLQPVVIFAYVSLMMTAYDLMLTGTENSLLSAIAGECATSGGNIPSKCLADNGVLVGDKKNLGMHNNICWASKTNNVNPIDIGAAGTAYNVTGATAMDSPGNKCFRKEGRPFDSFDLQKLASITKSSNSEKVQEEIALATITMALTAFVFSSLLSYLLVWAVELAGGHLQVTSLNNAQYGHDKLIGGDMMGQLSNKISSPLSGAVNKGTQSFLNAMPSWTRR